MNNKIKQLNKAYAKRFKQLTDNTLAAEKSGITILHSDIGLIVFVEHLKYLRDIYIITRSSMEIIVTLNAAIEEFEAFKSNQKDFHWNNFCEIVKLNMKEWLAVNDPV